MTKSPSPYPVGFCISTFYHPDSSFQAGEIEKRREGEEEESTLIFSTNGDVITKRVAH